MNDVPKEEHGFLGFDLGDRSCFYPFGKLVDSDKQVGVTPGRLLEGPDQIKPQNHEWPHGGDGLECLGWQMGLPHVVLTCFAGAYNVHGISHRGRPVETLSESVPDEGPRRSVVSTRIVMDVLQQLSPLLGGHTALQDLGVALFIELSADANV
jgi:hypothetical protein